MLVTTILIIGILLIILIALYAFNKHREYEHELMIDTIRKNAAKHKKDNSRHTGL